MRAIHAFATATLLVGCATDADVATVVKSIAHAGPWMIPSETRAIGDMQAHIAYVDAGPWVGEGGCAGGMEPGTATFREYLLQWFPQTSEIGGYSCRPIVGASSQMSVHATGRALDIMIPLAGDYNDEDSADNDLGDPIGNWLIENSERIGISYIIWNRWTWGAHRDPGAREKAYTGEHPHHDHLHIELSVAAAAKTTPFFAETNPMGPEIPRCEAIASAGAVIDENAPCVQFFGASKYWRIVDGEGYGGSLRWTNAFENDTASNWARFVLDFADSGTYDVEVYLDPAYAVFRDTRYAITHAEGVTEVVVDQSAVTEPGFVKLGTFEFEAGMHHDVAIFDNALSAVADEQHIAVDAIRFAPPGQAEEENGSGLDGGCSTGRERSSGLWLAGLLALGFWRRRPRRKRETPTSCS